MGFIGAYMKRTAVLNLGCVLFSWDESTFRHKLTSPSVLLHHMRCLAILVRYPVTAAPVSTLYLQCDSCVWRWCELDQGTDLLLERIWRFLKANQAGSWSVLAHSCLDWEGGGRRGAVSARAAKNTLSWYCFQTLRL